MTAYGAEPRAPAGLEHPEIPHPKQLEEPQSVEIPADMRAPAPIVPSTEPIPKVAPSAPPTIPQTLPVIPATSEPSPSSEPRIAISISEYRGLCHTLQTLTATQSILTQQMITIRAIRIRLSPPKPNILPSLGRYSSTWVFYPLLSTIFLSHKSLQIHHRALL